MSRARMPNVAAPLVMVLWVDSAGQDGWRGVEEIRNTTLDCLSVGWLTHDTPEHLTLVPHAAMNDERNFDQVKGYMTIPRVAVKQVQVLQKANCRAGRDGRRARR